MILLSKVDSLDSPNVVPLDYRNQEQVHRMGNYINSCSYEVVPSSIMPSTYEEVL